MFKVNKILVKNAIASAKSEYYNKKVRVSKGNKRTVFSLMNNTILHKSQIVISKYYQFNLRPIILIISSVQKILNLHSVFPSSTLSQVKLLVEAGSCPCKTINKKTHYRL